MIEVVNGKKVKAVEITAIYDDGCINCTFINICNRHSERPQHRNMPKLHFECMAKYRFDNKSVYFLETGKI